MTKLSVEVVILNTTRYKPSKTSKNCSKLSFTFELSEFKSNWRKGRLLCRL